MIDLDNLMRKVRAQAYGDGYKVDDRVEINAVYDFLKRMNIPTENFVQKLKTLSLIQESSNGIIVGGYNATTNSITYSTNEDLYHELFHVVSSKSTSKATGITLFERSIVSGKIEKFNVGLDEGITDMLTEMTKSDLPCGYPFEKLCAETLRDLFGIQIFNGYFNNSYDEFIDSFPQNIEIDIIDLITNLDEYQREINSIYFAKEENNTKYRSNENLSDITESIIRTLITIGQSVGKNKEEMIEYLNVKIYDPKIQSIRELIDLDQAFKNVTGKNL